MCLFYRSFLLLDFLITVFSLSLFLSNDGDVWELTKMMARPFGVALIIETPWWLLISLRARQDVAHLLFSAGYIFNSRMFRVRCGHYCLLFRDNRKKESEKEDKTLSGRLKASLSLRGAFFFFSFPFESTLNGRTCRPLFKEGPVTQYGGTSNPLHPPEVKTRRNLRFHSDDVFTVGLRKYRPWRGEKERKKGGKMSCHC